MKFRIKHETPLFQYGTFIPLCVPAAALLIYVFLGLNVNDNFIPTMVLIGISAVSIAAELLFIILFFGEKIWGSKIIVQSDHLDIRLFLRRKKIHFDNINDVKYTHYEVTDSDGERRSHSTNLFVRYNAHLSRTWVRSRLIIYLSSGKKLSINDDAPGYEKKRKLWITEPDVDPDEDVKLYQAYKCYLAAARQYFIAQQ